MWDNYKPTAAEKRAILAGLAVVAKYAHSDYELRQNVDHERYGYGIARAQLPKIGAQALIVKWFHDGVIEPDMLARDIWNIRPSAIWATGTGLYAATRISSGDRDALTLAVAAHEAAFARMQEATRQCS